MTSPPWLACALTVAIGTHALAFEPPVFESPAFKPLAFAPIAPTPRAAPITIPTKPASVIVAPPPSVPRVVIVPPPLKVHTQPYRSEGTAPEPAATAARFPVERFSAGWLAPVAEIEKTPPAPSLGSVIVAPQPKVRPLIDKTHRKKMAVLSLAQGNNLLCAKHGLSKTWVSQRQWRCR